MVDLKTRAQYLPTIGIECHVQLKTATKLFAAVGNDAREAPPNTLISHICFGLPGALPVLNEAVIDLAARAAFALGTTPQKFSKFDRKHYFYPDLPKGYQITQYEQPIIVGGFVTINTEVGEKRIGITRAHLEEDAGKSTHPEGKNYSLVDLNRAGTPLLEIVSEPDMHTSEEAKAYVRELYLRMKYADVSDANLYYGNMRFDVNVSVSPDTKKLGIRSETKNLNSFRSVEKAVDYEINRQIELLEKGQSIVQETRGWDDAKQKTFSQRTKEDAHDYRYFPEPDVPPMTLSDAFIEQIRATMPAMPEEWRSRLSTLGVDQATVDLLLEIQAQTPQDGYLNFIESNLANPDFAKQATNWIVNVIEPTRANKALPLNTAWTKILTATYELLKQDKLSSTNAKAIITDLLDEKNFPANVAAFAQSKGYIQVSDEAEIANLVKRILADNQKVVEDVKGGETKAIGFLVGQVMKASQGKANPQLVQALIKKQINI